MTAGNYRISQTEGKTEDFLATARIEKNEVQKCIPKTILNRIHEKGYRNRPLTKGQKRENAAKSKIRARVEHVFGAMHHYGGIFMRSIGIKRAEIQIGLLNLTYNMKRYVYLMEAYA